MLADAFNAFDAFNARLAYCFLIFAEVRLQNDGETTAKQSQVVPCLID